ncbi:MAG: hypothetical protein SFY80_05315 [Verrucomicrobiota bacterium]|nr:hypothetical protein [Verrucomicrobiota bacterium]
MYQLTITPTDAHLPVRLLERLGSAAPSELTTIGNLDLLTLPKTALFCSARCPGDAILRTHDQAARWRDEMHCVISGFHSPMEQDCLRILLRGISPVIICPARAIPKRLPPSWKQPLAEGRMLILSAFEGTENRMTAALAESRNALVAALADVHYFAHITPGGHLDKLAQLLKQPRSVGGSPASITQSGQAGRAPLARSVGGSPAALTKCGHAGRAP